MIGRSSMVGLWRCARAASVLVAALLGPGLTTVHAEDGAPEAAAAETRRPGGLTRDPDQVCPARGDKVLAIGSSTLGAPLGGMLGKAVDAMGLRWHRLAAASSGLARPDFWDWAAKTRQLVAEHDPDVVIVQLGSNDYQSVMVRVDDTTWRPVRRGKPEWEAVYAARIDELLEIVGGGERERLVLWVGPYAYWGDNAIEQGPRIDALLTDRIATWVARGGFARYVNVWRETWDERHGPVMKRRLPGARGLIEIRSGDNIHLNVLAVRTLLAEPVLEELRRCRAARGSGP